jgi:hypothetical protein
MRFRLRTGLYLGIAAMLIAPCYPEGSPTTLDKALPSPAPEVQGVFPHGGIRGSSVRVRITGKKLGDVTSIQFARAGLNAEIVSRTDSELLTNIRIDNHAEPGRHDLRLISSMGSNIAWFDVGTLAEITEVEPNDSPKQAQQVTLPALVNGIIAKGDYDFFRFTAKGGETITFDVNGNRNGSPLDGVIAIFDEQGEQLDYNDDHYIFKDPHLTYRFEKAGTYLVRVNGSEEGGSQNSDYRLTMGSIPYISHAMPSGARRGQTVTLRLHGVNLTPGHDVILGPGLASGKLTKAAPDHFYVRLAIPKNLAVGVYSLHVDAAVRAIPFVIGDLPETTVTSIPTRGAPAQVKLPVVVNGVLGAKGEAHYFRFHVDAPGQYVVAADSMHLGFPLDPLVSLHDAEGKRIAYQDEPNTNNGLQPSNLDPHLVVDIPTAGDYIARVRDFAYRGAPEFVYRLTLKKADPDFDIHVHVPDETLFRGRENRIKVRIRRREGWNSPVEIRAENLPVGVTAEPVTAAPTNTTYLGGCAETHTINGTDVELVVRTAADAAAAQQPLRIVARGMQNGRTVEKEGWTHYRWRGGAWGDAETGRLLATIVDPLLLVLEPSSALKLSNSSHEGTVEVVVKRFDGGSEPLLLAPSGDGPGEWEVTADPVPPAATKTRLKLRPLGSVPPSLVLVGTAGGRVLGRSPSIRVQVEDPAGKVAE